MSQDIRDILNRFSEISETKSAKQLPALFRPKDISPVLTAKKDPDHPTKGYFVGGESEEQDEDAVTEAQATEDVISDKKSLGDYLQDVAQAIKKDPDLLDKLDQKLDQLGPAVKTIHTDDGHEIKIHGNEDDGFRISIRNRPSTTRFKNLDEAAMAVEMFCARRASGQQKLDADYLDEA